MNRYRIYRRRQSGAVLITGLVLLLVLTLIGVTAMRSTTLEERMARNLREVNVAFQMSETGLSGGENWVNTSPVRPIGIPLAPKPDYVNNQVYALNNPYALSLHEPDKNKAWWDLNATSDGLVVDPDLGGGYQLKSTPRFAVEEVGFVPDSLDLGLAPPPGRMYYRISATGVASRDVTQSIVQSTFAIRL